MKIQNAVNEGSQILKFFKNKTPLLDSEILMSKAIRKDRHFIILNPDRNIKKK